MIQQHRGHPDDRGNIGVGFKATRLLNDHAEGRTSDCFSHQPRPEVESIGSTERVMMTQNSTHPTPQQLVECLYEAFNRGDFKTIIEQLADNLDWNESENFMLWDRSHYRTPAAVAEGVFGRLAAQIRGCLAIPTAIFDAGDTIVALGRAKGMCNATGRSFDAQYVHIWHVQNEKVVSFRQIIDTFAVWRAQQGL